MTTNDFGRWLQRHLDRREWRQADFARRTGLSTGTISHWITGRRIPDPPSCDLIADVLGLDVDVVLTAAGHRPNIEEIDPDSVEAEMIGMVRRVEWTEERVLTMRSFLRQWIELDRAKQK